MNGDPFHIGAYSVGDTFMTCDYDLPSGALSQTIRGVTRGPVQFEDLSCLELLTAEYSVQGDFIAQSRRIVYVGPRFARTLFTHRRRANGEGLIEKIQHEVPRFINLKSKWRVKESRLQPDSSFESSEIRQKIGGFFRVNIGKTIYHCLQWIRTRISPTGGHEAEEVLICVRTGLTVMIRHYIGRGWPNLDDHKKSPKMENGGEIYYLWFVRRVLRPETTSEA